MIRVLMSALLAFCLALSSAAAQELLTLERLFESPGLAGASPRAVAYSPDGRYVTFLKPRADDARRLDLWAFEVATGEAAMLVDSKTLEPDGFELSEEEKALRERKRIASSRGIVQYQWDSAGERILVPLAGDLFLVELADGAVRRLTETDAFEYDAKVSPAGGYVSFLRDGALYAIDLDSGRERRLSPRPEEGISYGTAEFVAQEEMQRYTGSWWSPDDGRLAYTRVDERGVDVIPRFDIAAGDVTVIEQRYPRAGRPNAVVDLFIRRPGRRGAVKVAWGASPDTYLARVTWGGPETLYVQTVNRDQTELTLARVDVATGAVDPVYRETQPTWINLSKDLKPLDDGSLLWTTEESGFRHILHIDASGDARAVTRGDWPVIAIEGVDEEAGLVYFTAHKDTPLERHLYRVRFRDPGEPERITPLGLSWRISFAPDAGSYVGTASSTTRPPHTAIYSAAGERIAWVEDNALDADHPYAPYLEAHVGPEFGTLKADDGQVMYYSIIKPHDFDPARQYPAIVNVYGGPRAQRVTNSFGMGLVRDQYKQQQGYVVFQLDNRGSFGRGKAFEDPIHLAMAGVEVTDQVQAAQFLASLPYVDPERIGVMGWSYGGYMALHLALRAPQGTYAAAISGAPVTDWSLYDTFYTERYMRTPQANPEGYEASSVFPYLDNLSIPLLMIHGMADDNVTFDNSTRVYARLQEAAVPFSMMTYPGQRHGIRAGGVGEHNFGTMMRFFGRHLEGRP